MRTEFECIDGHTCGNPVRVVKSGGPDLVGETMMEKREDFMKNHDWIRKSLMFEPRGHDMMSGTILYPPSQSENDAGVLYIETSGCLPMCGHGTIGMITIALEEGLISPKSKGKVRLETPAGLVLIDYKENKGKVVSVKLKNVPSFMVAQDIEMSIEKLGSISVDISYGGNFYAIVDIQDNFTGLQDYSAGEIVAMSRELREFIAHNYHFEHPEDDRISGVHHVMWSGVPLDHNADARNAVFYGEKAIDRSPCGTGTSARMAQLFAKGQLKEHESFVHESIIGSKFTGKIEAVTKVGPYPAIVPSIEGWAKITGYNRIIVDQNDDPFWEGFSVI